MPISVSARSEKVLPSIACARFSNSRASKIFFSPPADQASSFPDSLHPAIRGNGDGVGKTPTKKISEFLSCISPENRSRSGFPVCTKRAHIFSETPRQDSANSTFIAHSSAAVADALSTALFVAGWENSMKFLEDTTPSPAAGCIDENEIPRWNGIFQNLWGSPIRKTFVSICLLLAPLITHADDDVDLGSMGANAFTPYVFDRNRLWMILPIFMIAVVLIHLRKPEKVVKKSQASLP